MATRKTLSLGIGAAELTLNLSLSFFYVFEVFSLLCDNGNLMFYKRRSFLGCDFVSSALCLFPALLWQKELDLKFALSLDTLLPKQAHSEADQTQIR